MASFKQLLHEIHRRSLWQILALYTGASWFIFEIVETLTDGLGLPDWVPPLAFVLLLIGLPIVLATAIVQKGGPALRSRDATLLPELASSSDPKGGSLRSGLRRLFTWRNAVAGGLVAFSLGGLVVATYMGMRAYGIGPVGTLVAKGVLEPQDSIVLAHFEDHAHDSTLALAVTEALRVDLSQSPMIQLAQRSRIRRALQRMQRDPHTPLDSEVARELAIREGLKAVIAGDVYRAGAGYVVSGRVVSAETGDPLVIHRETASGPAEVIPAIDRLSARLRERIGESLKSIRSSRPLPRVTTASLEALKKYALAFEPAAKGDDETAIALLEEATAIDSSFARAYTRLALVLANALWRRTQMVSAMEKALKYKERLPEREALWITHSYHSLVTGNWEEAERALLRRLELRPKCQGCLINLGRVVPFDSGGEMYSRRAIEMDSTRQIAPYANLIRGLADRGRIEEAESTLAALDRHFPDNYWVWLSRVSLAASRRDYASAEKHARELLRTQDRLAVQQPAHAWLAALALLQGRLAEAEEHSRAAASIAERRGLSNAYIGDVIKEAEVDLWYRSETQRALRTVDLALQRYPLDSLPLLERPCLEKFGWGVSLCEFWARAGETERARSLFAQFEASDDPITNGKDSYTLHGIRGVIALSEGKGDSAVAELRRYAAGEDCLICALPYLGQAYEIAGRPDSALAVYQRYVEGHHFFRYYVDRVFLPFVYERLATLHEAAGEPSEAIRYHQSLVELWKDADPELSPRLETSRQAISRLSAALGLEQAAGR